MKIVSYDDRVLRMRKPGDEDKQLRLAKAYVIRLRRKMKNAMSFDEQQAFSAAVNDSEKVLRMMRLNIFDLQDMLERNINLNNK